MTPQDRFVEWISSRLAGGKSISDAFSEWIGDGHEEIRQAEADRSDSLNKTYIGTVDFLGEKVKVFTVNGQYARSPLGANVIEFTMGGNWYGGSKPDTYHPICNEDEIVLHDLMSEVDTQATLVHELVERYMMKNYGLDYDDAHSGYAEPMEKIARRVLESSKERKDAAGT